MIRLAKALKTDSKQVEGGKSIRGSDGKLHFMRMKEVNSGRIIWKGSQMKKMIGLKMWMEMQ